MSARHVATCRDMSARHVEDIIEIIGLKRHEMSCLHDMSATGRGILVGLVNGSMLGGYDRLSLVAIGRYTTRKEHKQVRY